MERPKRILPVLILYCTVAIAVIVSSREIQGFYILGAAILACTSIALFSFAWRTIFRMNSITITQIDAIRFQLIEQSLFIFPLKANVLAIPLLIRKKYKQPLKKVIPNKIYVTLIELIAVLVLSAEVVSPQIPLTYQQTLVTSLVISVIILVMITRWKSTVISFIKSQKLKEYLKDFYEVYRFKSFAVGLGLFILAWITEAGILVCIGKSFGIDIMLLDAAGIITVSVIIGLLSLIPGGIGSTELSITALLGSSGIEPVLAGKIAVIYRIFVLIIPMGIGYLYLIHELDLKGQITQLKDRQM